MEKTRNLSIAEYFVQIQLEYLIADFKRKIYYNPKDKAYWTKVCNYKKEKIEEIANRSHLNTIFNSSSKMLEFRKRIFDSNNKPTFQMNEKDWNNYYMSGNEFSYNGEIYILEQIKNNKLFLRDSLTQKCIEVDKEKVSRII